MRRRRRRQACDLPPAGTFLLNLREDIMGKYFLAWLLGVPAFVLLLIYFFFR